MRGLGRVGEVLLASTGGLSILVFSLHLLPPPYGSILLGGGVGLLAVEAEVLRRNRPGRTGKRSSDLPRVPGGMQSLLGLRPRSNDRARILGRYDKVFSDMLGREGHASRSASVEQLKPILYELSPEIRAWEPDVRLRVYLLMREVAKGLDDPEFARASLGALVMILSRGGPSAVEMARPILGDKIATMYSKAEYKGERLLPRLKLLMDDYEATVLGSVASDAIHLWDTDKFWATHEYLGLEGLTSTDSGKRLKDMLGREIVKAGSENDKEALNRAMELYNGLGWSATAEPEGNPTGEERANIANALI